MAKHVGVSQATVSRELNGKPGISDATRAAVLTALDVLGYELTGNGTVLGTQPIAWRCAAEHGCSNDSVVLRVADYFDH